MMEEAPTVKEGKTTKTFELTSDKGNKYIFTFKNIKSTSLLIEALFDDGIVKTFFESEFTLEKIKENKAFISYDTIDDILEELFPLIDENEISLFEKEENQIKFIFDLPFRKYKTMEFLISEKKKTSDAKIDELYDIIIKQNKEIKDLKMNSEKELKDLKSNSQKEIKDLKTKLNDVINELKIMAEQISKLEIEHEKVLKKKKYEDNIIVDGKSDIFNSLDEIDFIIARLRSDQKLVNKKIIMKLLFKATRDGQHCSKFHSKCDGKVQQLVFVKTTKGEVFGGYTEIGFRSRNDSLVDNNAFVFSFLTKKIYNSKNNMKVIYDNSTNGPCFKASFYGAIYIPSNMLEDKSHTCDIKNSYFKGMSIDYELNNGVEYFFAQEIEVYQILCNY